MSAKTPIRTVFDGSNNATGLAEFQSGEFIALSHGGLGASLSIGSAGQVLKVNSGASALEFGTVEAVINVDGMTDGTGITVADTDKLIISDAGTEKMINASQLRTYVQTNTGNTPITNLDIDGGTDIGEDLVDADLFIVDNGAGGTNRKVAASRIKTYIGGGTQWQSIKTSNYTASAGQGVFMNTTSSALTLTLPASPSIGDEVTFVDYAGTFDTNNLTIARNSSKIHGAEEDLTVATERAANTLVFTDSTQGWLLKSK